MWINFHLLPLKMLIFFLYAGLGCLMPFLTIHMYHLGLSHEEVTWINTVLPLTVLVGPPLAGVLADKFGHYRLITIVAMVLAGLFHTALLFIPERAPTYAPAMQLICGNNGSNLVLQNCHDGDECPSVDVGTMAKYRISQCRQKCNIEHDSCSALVVDMVKIIHTEVMISDILVPNICLHNDTDSNCHDFSYSTYLDLTTTFGFGLNPKSEYFNDFSDCCEFPLNEYSVGGSGDFHSFTCAAKEGCQVVCTVEEQMMEESSLVLQRPTCTADNSNPQTTFWLYFFVRSLADMFPAILIALLDAVVLTMVAQHGGDYGRQKMFGLFAIGISAPVVGYLMDKNVLTHGKYQYAPVFYIFDILMVVTAFITFTLPFKVDVRRTSMAKNLGKLIRTAELNFLFIIVILLGAFWGFLETFLYMYMLQDLSSTNLLLGLTITAGLVPSVPFLYNSDIIVKICGHHYLLMLAFVCYCIRFAGLSYLSNPYWVLPLETLELFTLNLMQVSAATLTYKLAPKALLATAQGLVWMAHFDVGRSLGTIVGGYLIKDHGTIYAFKVCCVVSAFCAAIYLASHQYAKHHKKRKAIIASINRTAKNGQHRSNGSYTKVPLEEKF